MICSDGSELPNKVRVSRRMLGGNCEGCESGDSMHHPGSASLASALHLSSTTQLSLSEYA